MLQARSGSGIPPIGTTGKTQPGERLGVTPDGTGESLNELVRFLGEPTAKGA
jgi:hypothetical protein